MREPLKVKKKKEEEEEEVEVCRRYGMCSVIFLVENSVSLINF